MTDIIRRKSCFFQQLNTQQNSEINCMHIAQSTLHFQTTNSALQKHFPVLCGTSFSLKKNIIKNLFFSIINQVNMGLIEDSDKIKG